MYNNSKNILTGVLCAIVIAAIVVGVLFACGVFKKDVTTKTKLPISYPDKTINWMSLDDGKTLRAAFNDKLDLNKDKALTLIVNINNIRSENFCISLDFLDGNSSETLGYDTWCGNSYGYLQFYDIDTEYRIAFILYNNATLNDKGDVTSGDGFVLSIGNLQQVGTNDDGEETLTDIEIESIKIVSMYQDTVNKLLK